MDEQEHAGAPSRRAPRLRWWREVLYIVAFYGVYTLIRNRGLDQDSRLQAFTNAKRVVRVERLLGSYHEESIQDLFLRSELLVQALNIFYGTAHFIVTAAALIWCFRRAPHRYQLWRTTLAFTTALALVGFAFFPLMPPRLMPPSYGFVDTLAEIGGLWSFDSGAMKEISNQYAAMPSLHFGWSSWSALVLLPGVRRRWLAAAVVAYPFVTLLCIVVTGNHFWLDAAGGALVLGAGYLLARWVTRRLERRGAAPVPETVDTTGPTPAAQKIE